MRGLIAILLCAAGASSARADDFADIIVLGGTIHTGDGKTAEAFAVKDGRFLYVGKADAVRKWSGPKTTVQNGEGKTVVPGFIDAHAHPRPIYPADSRHAPVEADPEFCPTIDDLILAIRAKAKVVPKGEWILGGRYQETKLGRHPTRADLDKGSTDHPILITHSSGHLSVCNSLALNNAKIDKATKDPAGGVFERDRDGEPTGLLKERAAGIVRSAGPKVPNPTHEEVLAGYRECFRRYAEKGLTGVHVAGTDTKTAETLAEAQKGIPVRLYIMLREGQIDEAVKLKKRHADDDSLRFGAIKLFQGNSLSGQTAWLKEPYAKPGDYYGVPPARNQKELDSLILKIHSAGLQCAIHSNGDREIEMVLDAFEAALRAEPRAGHRHRIEHCSVVNPEILGRIKKLELAVAPHSYIWEHGDKMENYGKNRWDWVHPNRSLVDQGTIVAGNSDSPVSAADPLLRLHDLVYRESAEGQCYGPKQKLEPAQALRVFTLGSAQAEFAEKFKGTIETGRVADYVILSGDPLREKSIRTIRVERTVIGGKTVHETKK